MTMLLREAQDAQPTVEAIIPLYRGERYVAEAIESVLAQTYPRCHLTIVDDASPGGPAEIVASYAAEHPARIALLPLAENVGPAGARMAGVEASESDLIAFLDQDDRWQPDYLARMVRELQATSADAAHAGLVFTDSASQPAPDVTEEMNRIRLAGPWARGGLDLQRYVAKHGPVYNSALVVRRASFQHIGGFRAELRGGEDWEFWTRATVAWRIAAVPDTLVLRRLHEHNTGYYLADARASSIVRIMKQVAAENPNLVGVCRWGTRAVLRRAVRRALEGGNWSSARARAADLWRESPWDLRALVLSLCSALHIIPFWGQRRRRRMRQGSAQHAE